MYTHNTGFTGECSVPHKPENIKGLFTYLKVFNKPEYIKGLFTYLKVFNKPECIKGLFTYLKVFNKPKSLELRIYLNLTNEPSDGT